MPSHAAAGMKPAIMPLLLASLTLVPAADAGPATPAPVPAIILTRPPVVHYRSETVDDVKLFYREAGPEDAPVVLLLHGFPTSSHMFRNLIPILADRYHVIASDCPGFGNSAMPDLDFPPA